MKAEDVSKFLILASDVLGLGSINSLKLHSLLYYAQGTYVGKYSVPLFEDKIYKSHKGPQVVCVEDGDDVFVPPSLDNYDGSRLSREVSDHLVGVLETYGRYSSLDLSEMSLRERPLAEADLNNEVLVSRLKSHFSDHSEVVVL